MSEVPSQTLMLLRRFHGGDAQALADLVTRHLDWIRAHVHRRLGARLREKAETEDFVQEAALAALRHGPRFVVSDEAHFRALLARIVESAICDQHAHFSAKKRDSQKERALGSDSVLELDPPRDAVTRPSELAQRRECGEMLDLALALLDAEDREAILLRQKEQLSFAEIGARVGISEDAARFRFHRALPRLASKIEALGGGRLDDALA